MRSISLNAFLRSGLERMSGPPLIKKGGNKNGKYKRFQELGI